MTTCPPAFKAGCPSRLILDQIADKWSVLVLGALCKQPLRFNAIKRELEGITQKALTQTLRKLERNGIVARRVMPVSPVAVEYRITPLGQTLKVPFEALYRWTVEYLPQIEQARQDYDLRIGTDRSQPNEHNTTDAADAAEVTAPTGVTTAARVGDTIFS